MRAFEVYLNRKKLCVAGLDDQGDLLFSVASSQNPRGLGGIGLGMTGRKLSNETIRWQQLGLRINDEVRIKIVEAKTVDPFQVLQKAPRDSRKYEKAAVRRMAKEFGWKIETKPRKA